VSTHASPPTAHDDESAAFLPSVRPQEAPAAGSSPASAPLRPWHERASTRLLAMVGIVGIATIVGAVLVGENVAGWIVGLVVGLISSAIAARLWSSGAP
jgi:hypothetical protein